ncbi:MAG: restriction endonuclease, partial [Candidatus Marsarchaeota archaeon]|nr:restriction endonuclease [Candidatus Marsarchaeota archaeon]
KSNEISQRVGIAPNQLSFYFKTLVEWEWAAKEYPLGERSDARAIYKIDDHFIHFWYRFVSRLRSDLEFNDTEAVYRARVRPYLDQYVGQFVFEDICHQYLRLRGSQLIGQPIRRAGRYWSRDGRVELDIMGELDDGTLLLGECKWSSSPVGLPVYYSLRDKIALLPQKPASQNARLVIFSLAGFDNDLAEVARRENLVLVSGEDLLRL